MSFIRKFTRKNKNSEIKTYYAEVESIRVGKKVIQRYIRSLGTDPEHPNNFQLDPMNFSSLALRLMKGDLTPNDVFELLEDMGQPVKRETLERIGIFYEFDKKNYYIYLFYPKKRLKKPQNDVQNAEKSPTPRKHLKE
jgi:hypothetical protein